MAVYNTDFFENSEQHAEINALLSNITHDFAVWISAKIDPLGLQPSLVNQIVSELESDSEYLEILSNTVLQDEEAKSQDPNNTNGVGLAEKFREGVLQVGGATAQGYLDDIIKAASQVANSAETMRAIRDASNVASEIGHFGNAMDITKGVAEYVKSGFSPTEALEQFMNIAVPAAVVGYAAALLATTALPAVIAGVAVGILGFAASQAVSAVSPHIARAVEAAADFYAEQVGNAIAGIADIGRVIGSIADFYTDQIGNVYVGVVAIGNLIGSLAEALGQELGNFVDTLQGFLDAAGQEFANAADWLSGVLDAWGLSMIYASPLVLDLDGDGIELVSLANTSVYWDLDADGFAEAAGWVGADDGLLAIDLNNDGVISTHEELFGNMTTDGFTDLRTLDSNADNVINANDAQFDDLLVWKDVNQNGVSDEGELYSLDDLNITSINLNASMPYNTFIEGNRISHVSTYTMDDGISPPQTLAIVDAWFAYDNVNSRYDQDYTLDLASLFVVTQRGYGLLPDMHIAASIDNDTNNPDSLMSLLAAFTANDASSVFAGGYEILDDVRAIMYRWAGVDDVDPTSRGANVDARQVEFLEALTAEKFLQLGWNPDPGNGVSHFVKTAFDIALCAVAGRLVAQVAAADLFEGNGFYNPLTDKFEGVTGLNQTALDALLAQSNNGLEVSDKTGFWVMVVNAIDEALGVENLSPESFDALEDALFASDADLSVQNVLDRIEWAKETHFGAVAGGEFWYGTNMDDVYTGGSGNDTLGGGYGNDTVYGGLGDDVITAGADNDTFIGGLGNDVLQKFQGGADTYVYLQGHGHDIIREYGFDIDTIQFGEGIALSDLTIQRINSNDFGIQIAQSAGGGSLTIGGAAVELLKFADNSITDLRLMDHVYFGTSGNDVVWGHHSGVMGTGSDTMYGYDGNDTLMAYAANEYDMNTNTLYGGNGNDGLSGSSGNDFLYGENDNDTLESGNGNDFLVGGAGNDILRGGGNNDTYVFNYGDGNDSIDEWSGIDTIVFGEGITQEMLNIYRVNNNDVRIEIDGGAGGSLFIAHQTYESGKVIEYIQFFDNSTLDLRTFEMTLVGTAANDGLYGSVYGASNVDRIYGMDGNDAITAYRVNGESDTNYLYGGNGNDTIHGSNGVDYLYGENDNDILRGGAGNDIYLFEYGDGADTIEEYSGSDKIVFGAGITLAMLNIYRATNFDVKIDIDGGVGGSITIKGQHYSSGNIVETIEFNDGSIFDLSSLDFTLNGTAAGESLHGTAIASSGVDTIYGHDGNDNIYGYYGNPDTKTNYLYGGNGNDAIYGASGTDYLSGGVGNDILAGGLGNDIYLFEYGDGADTIEEYHGSDKIVFGAGITQAMLSIYRTSNFDIKIDIDGGVGGSITIKNQNNSTSYVVETLEFSDASTINLQTLSFTLNGTAAGETLYGTNLASSGIDTIYGHDGNDSIHGYYSSSDTNTNYLYGGNGNDAIYGASGTDYLHGENGNDTLIGNSGDDILFGGVGNDILAGGLGNDIYLFEYGDGVDTIEEYYGSDKIVFGAGITQAMLSIYRTSNFDIKIDIDGGVGGSITIKNQNNSTSYVVETLEFSDASTINLQTLSFTLNGTAAAETLYGTNVASSGIDTIYGHDGNDAIHGYYSSSDTNTNYLYGGNGNDAIYGASGTDYLHGENGNDTLIGNSGDDILFGGVGNDILAGGLGNDIYLFEYGDGADTIEEYHGSEKIVFGAGITQAMLNIYRTTTFDIKIDVDGGVGGSITIKNQNNSTSYVVETLEFSDASTINLQTLSFTLNGTAAAETLYGTNVASSGIDTIYGHDGNDSIHGHYSSADTNTNYLYGGNGNDAFYGSSGIDYLYGESGNDTLNGYNGDDILFGGVGNDILRGESGNDIYLFEYGDGVDTIEEYNGSEKIVFGAGITLAMLNIYRATNFDLKIDIDGGVGGSITIKGQHYSSGNVVETLEFADSSTFSLLTPTLILNGTAAAETLYGTNVASSGIDTIYGHDGNDAIHGYYSVVDTNTNYLYGGNGNDVFYGASGVDYLHGENGNDTLNGYGGNDLLYGGSGSDTLAGGGGADQFVFTADSAFSGVDTITDFNKTHSDKIDISDLLDLYDPLNDVLTDFVSITQSGAHSILAVDVDGGANNFVHIATLSHTSTLTDVQALYGSGNLIVD